MSELIAVNAANIKLSESVTAIALPVFATDHDLIEDWITSKPSIHTRKQYRRTIRQFLDFVRKPLSMTSGSDLQAWIDAMNVEGLRKDSQRSKVSVVKALFNHATLVGYLERNLVRIVKTPPARAKAKHRIVEEGDLMAVLRFPGLTAIEQLLINTLYYTGCRVSEVVRMRWEDIDGDVLTVYGKGDQVREIKLPRHLLALLDTTRSSRTSDYIFPTRTGRSINRQQAGRYIKAIAQKCGLPNLSCHWLRHCHASHALKRGADINLVAETLGHSSVAVTSRYLHASPDESSGCYLI